MAVGCHLRLAVACAAAWAALGCMPPPSADEPWPGARALASEYHWPPRVQVASDEPGPSGRTGSGVSLPVPAADGTSLAGPAESTTPGATLLPPAFVLPSNGDGCLPKLKSSGLDFERQKETRGVELPVILRGSVGGVEYWANDKRPLLVDCRLALALEHIAPVLRSHGVTRARFSGAYVYRNTRSGRLSLHARGLAIDIHDVVVHGKTLTVKRDFARGAGCTPNVPVLNRIACDLARMQLFRELLTPDYDRDHHDHFHLAVGER